MQPLLTSSHLTSDRGDNTSESFQQEVPPQFDNDKPPVVRSGNAEERVPLMCNYIAMQGKLTDLYQRF